MNEWHLSIESTAKIISISVLVALLVWESLAPCYQFFKDQARKRFGHGIINLLIFVLNTLIAGSLFLAFWVKASSWAAENQFGVVHWLELPVWAEATIAVLLFDLWTYWWHRGNHVIPFLWRFHRVHHSDTKMDVTTASRFHLGEIAISSSLRIPLIILIGADLWHLALYEMIMFPIVQFHHANIRIPDWADRVFRVFFPSPIMHKIHHSDEPSETNSNYTSLLSIWDRIFGSFRSRKDIENIRLGLKEFRSEKDQSLVGLISNPLENGPTEEKE